MEGTIIVRSLEFQARHGASADERKSARRFQVDVELSWEMSRAVESDRLVDTVNYYDVCALLLEIGSSNAHRLLESVGGAMVRAIRARWPHVAVTLELRKLHPPCPGNPAYTAVRLSAEP